MNSPLRAPLASIVPENAPFTAEHYSGRAHGDYSEVFFAKG